MSPGDPEMETPEYPELEIRALLRELSKEPEDPVTLFRRLEELTGVTPYVPGHEGKFRLLIGDWLEWGEVNGLMEEDPTGAMEEVVPGGDHPLVSVLTRMDARMSALEERGEAVVESLKKLAGIMEMLVEILSKKNEPWTSPGYSNPSEPEREDDSSSPYPAGEHPSRRVPQVEERKPVAKSPPVVREGRTYV